MFESRRPLLLFEHGVAAFLGFGWRDGADWPQPPSMVAPIRPFQRRELNGFKAPPWPASLGDLCFVEAVDGLCQRIGMTVANMPTEGSMPASARRSVCFMDTY